MRKKGRTPEQLEAEIFRLQQQVAGLEDALSRERRQAAEVRSNTGEARLKAGCEQSPHLAGILELDGTIRYVNRRALEVIGREPSAVIGRPIWDAPWWSHSEEEQGRVREGVRRAAQAAVQFETTHRAADGRLRYVDFALWPVREETGGVSFLLAEGRDITGHREAEEALRIKTEELDRYFTHALDLLCIADTDGYFRRLNREWETTLGYSLSELEGTRFLDYVHPEDRPATLNALSQLGAQEEVLNFVNRYRARDGSYRWIEWRSFPAGQRIYAVARDITDQRRADELLRENLTRLQTMVRNAPIVIYGVDRQGVFTLSEGKGLAALGFKPGEIVGRSAFEVYRKRPDILENFRRALAGETFTVPVQAGPHVFDAYHEPVLGTDGQYDGTLGVLVDVTKRKQAEDALRESQLFLETIFQQSPHSMWVSDSQGTLIRMNQACRDLLHVTDEDLVGKYNLFEDNIVEQQGVMPLVKRVFEHGEKAQFLLRYDSSQLRILPLSDTTPMVLEVTISPVLDARKQVIHAIVQHHDITERARAQEALERANRQLRLLSDCNQALIRAGEELELLATVCTILVRVGGYRMAWVGYAEDDPSKSVRPMARAGYDDGYIEKVCATWDAGDRGLGPIGTAIRTGQPSVIQNIASEETFAAWRAEAARRGYAAVCSLPLSAGERLFGTLSVYASEPGAFAPEEVAHLSELADDLAYGIMNLRAQIEHRRALETLRVSEERSRLIAENAKVVIWLMDLDLRYSYISPYIKHNLDYAPEEYVLKPLPEVLTPASLEKVLRLLTEELEEEKNPDRDLARSRTIEVEHIHRDGRIIWAEINMTFIRDAEGKAVGILGITRDISEQKRAHEEQEKLQAQLYQAQKMESVGRLAGGVAHDFNNMLTAILGHAELALMKGDPADPVRGDLQAIEESALRSADLVRQLLAFARKQTVSPKVLDLNDAVAGMLKMLRRLIGEDIDMVWMPGAGVWPVKIDPSQIDQLLANLCVNARDAIVGVGKITLETGNEVFAPADFAFHPTVVPGEYVLLAVSDDGCGMDPEVVEHIFEPFFSTKEAGKGTGLGLSTVYGIVKQNEGFINVYSEPGQGTTFKIYLPRYQGQSLEATSESPSEAPLGRGETVLLVEDDPVILGLAQTMLEKLGYTVLAAGTPGEAVFQAKSHAAELQLLITDVVMPEMNGRDLAELLKAAKPGLKCLFSSGYTANVIAHSGVLDEGVHFLQKPFSLKTLATKVREALEET